MTTYLDYQANPGDNNSPPPVGAPEGMFPAAVNDVLREIMSVIRQLGDQVSTTFSGLGSMAQQNAGAVAITGGAVNANLTGNGAGITALNAQALSNGPIQPGLLAGTYNITATHAQNADTVGGMPPSALVPIGAVVAYYGDPSNLDWNRWAVCDGSRGTPDLRDRYIRGNGPGTGFGAFGAYSGWTDSQGWHSHGGGTQPTTLSVAQMPSHQHVVTLLGGAGMSPSGGPWSTGTGTNDHVSTSAGGDQPHNHGINGDGAHTHNVGVNPPPSFGLWWIMRIG